MWQKISSSSEVLGIVGCIKIILGPLVRKELIVSPFKLFSLCLASQMTDARCSRCTEKKVGVVDIIHAGGHGDRYLVSDRVLVFVGFSFTFALCFLASDGGWNKSSSAIFLIQNEVYTLELFAFRCKFRVNFQLVSVFFIDLKMQYIYSSPGICN